MICPNCHFLNLNQPDACAKCGRDLVALRERTLPPGTPLHGGRYQIEYLIGSGAFGATYKARHVGLDQEVAIKEYLPLDWSHRTRTNPTVSPLSNTQDEYERGLARFLREGRLLGQIDFSSAKSIVRVNDLFEENQTAYLVMDYLQGQTLEAQVRAAGGKLSPDRVWDISQDLIAALLVMHDKQIWHCDIKPANVMILPNGRAVLVDFGAAHQGTNSKSTRLFTPKYAAPEIISGGVIDARSDLFSLGLVIYELLNGQMPDATDIYRTQTAWKSLVAPEPWKTLLPLAIIDDPNKRAPNVAEWWKRRPLPPSQGKQRAPKSKTTKPNTNVQNVPPVASPLTSVQTGPPPLNTPLPNTSQQYAPLRPAPKIRGNSSRKKYAFWVVLGLLTVGVGFTLGMQQRPRSYTSYSPSSAPAYVHATQKPRNVTVTKTSATRKPRPTPTDEPTPTPEPTATLAPDAPPVTEVTDAPIVLKGHAQDVFSTSWNSDGNRLASANGDGTIGIWDVASEQTNTVLEGRKKSVLCVAWSPDGQQLASASADGTVRVWDVDGGQAIATFKDDAKAVSWNPDGKQLATAGKDGTVRVWDTESEQSLALKGHRGAVSDVAWSADGKYLASAGVDGTVRVWDGENGQSLSVLQGHEGSVSCVAWRPDGQRLASAGTDGTVRFWDLGTDQAASVLQTQTDKVNSISWSPDGKQLASSSADGDVQIWDAENAQAVALLKGHTKRVYSVSWSPDGKQLASSSADDTIRVWDADKFVWPPANDQG